MRLIGYLFYNFWSHIGGSPTKIWNYWLQAIKFLAESKVNNFDFPFFVHHNVFKLDISMNNILWMNVRYRVNYLFKQQTSLVFFKRNSFSFWLLLWILFENKAMQTFTIKIFSDEINFCFVLKMLFKFQNAGMIKSLQNLNLIANTFSSLQICNSWFFIYFNCEFIFSLLIYCYPNTSVPSFPNKSSNLILIDSG